MGKGPKKKKNKSADRSGKGPTSGKKARQKSGRKTQKPAVRSAGDRPRLTDLSQVYRYFRSSTRPIYFVSPTPYNVLGIDQWVSGFRYISYFDSFDGAHPHLFSPSHSGPRDFESFESVNTYLLGNKEVVDYVNRTGLGQVLFVMFDEETEAMAREVGLEIALPPLELRQRIDSKVVTTQLGNEAGVASVPNVLGSVSSYEELLKLAKKNKLGSRLVVQTPYGDSGRTTFFISSREEFEEHREVIIDEPLKVMKYINHLPGTVEAAATRHGTIVGPIQTDLTGFEELTPYRGGWCGNDIFPTVFDDVTRKKIKRMARRLGKGLYREGYKGVFCMDFLIDTDTGDVYLGEINPRISGASPLTQLITATYGGVPLFLFHLLEFSEVDWELDLREIESRWDHHDRWSQLVLKQVTDDIELITEAPPSGLWRMADDGSISYLRSETDWHAVSSYDEAFYLRVYGDREYRYPGADIGVVVARGRMQTDDRHLLERARQWASGISKEFRGKSPEEAMTVPNSLLYTKWF